ncbi:hypothetical protein BIFDEN_01124 [Bifidobacterium dentium ATCC 27678]|nr:hypothetical protein BIFDEN_01124 [Bifidobacterium dentium ATCC 27678]
MANRQVLHSTTASIPHCTQYQSSISLTSFGRLVMVRVCARSMPAQTGVI